MQLNGAASMIPMVRPSRDKTDLPRTLGDYEIVAVLGEGGSGTVYLARRDGAEVALKVLRRDQAASERERRRWLEEAEHLGRIRHSGVVRIFDAGELDDGRPFLTMERLRGVTLAERVAGGPLHLDLGLRLFDQLASAVGAIHAAGLIHRDLKPENVMLVGDGDRAVLLDLGIARAADAPPSTTTRVGYQRGTPAVMAPERFFGERATVRSDIYELGVILFVMLTGSLPWRAILDAQARLNPLRPSELGVTLPPAMEQALMRALASDAAARPATVRALADEMRRDGWSGPTVPLAAVQATTDATGHASDGLDAASPARLDSSRTETGGGRVVTWAVRIALLAGLALIATPIAIAVFDSGEAAPARPSGVVALPEAIVEARPATGPRGQAPPAAGLSLDAAAAPLSSSADAGVAREPHARPGAPLPAERRQTPSSPARPAEPAGSEPTGPTDPGETAGALPWCRKQAALYCSDEFKATEGTLAGALCETMTEQVSKWEALPPAASASLEQACKQNHPALAAAAAERIRMHRDRRSPAGP